MGAPIVVQRPKVVSVSLKPTVANEVSQLPQKEEVATEAVPSTPIVQEVKQNDFSNDDLVRAWRLYAKKIEGELHTYNTMQNFILAKRFKETRKVLSINSSYVTVEDLIAKIDSSIPTISEEQQNKLMTLGLTEKEAEEQIINGFLK